MYQSIKIVIVLIFTLAYLYHQIPIKEAFGYDSDCSIEFLSVAEAQKVFLADAFDYHKSFAFAESAARTQSSHLTRQNYIAEIPNIYVRACLSFDSSQQQKLKKYIQREPLLKGLNWRFIKMQDKMDFSFPYTIANIIVLPESFISSVCDVQNRLTPETVKTLVHEQIHICQRNNPEIFRSYYEDMMNFKSTPELIIPSSVKEMMITNPDGLDKWVTSISGTAYFYCLMLKEEGSFLKIIKRAYPVRSEEYSEKEYRLTIDVMKGEPLEKFAKYHGGVSACYHPHEIYAYRLSDHLCSVYNKT